MFSSKVVYLFVLFSLKVFNWTPDLINATLGDEAFLPIVCSLASSDSNLVTNFV